MHFESGRRRRVTLVRRGFIDSSEEASMDSEGDDYEDDDDTDDNDDDPGVGFDDGFVEEDEEDREVEDVPQPIMAVIDRSTDALERIRSLVGVNPHVEFERDNKGRLPLISSLTRWTICWTGRPPTAVQFLLERWLGAPRDGGAAALEESDCQDLPVHHASRHARQIPRLRELVHALVEFRLESLQQRDEPGRPSPASRLRDSHGAVPCRNVAASPS
jgi:hypothetical protein